MLTEKQLALQERRAEAKAAKLAKDQQEVRAQWTRWVDDVQANPTLNLDDPETYGLTDRSIWLVFGVVEQAEKAAAAGKRGSARTFWFDGIAPRAPKRVARAGKTEAEYKAALEAAEMNATWGVDGFTTRCIRDAPRFLKGSGNGYVMPTDAAIELVFRLRTRHPELDPQGEQQRHLCRKLHIPTLGLTLRNTLWRQWKET